MPSSLVIRGPDVEGDVLTCTAPLSLWGGVDPVNGVIQDQQHPQRGHCLAHRVVMMPTSRGSCSGAGVLLDLVLSGQAPLALIFQASETTLTLGALVAAHVFGKPIPVVQLSLSDYEALAGQSRLTLSATAIDAESVHIPLESCERPGPKLEERDRQVLRGVHGKAEQVAMELVLAVATLQGASHLIDVSRVHIDACIYAAPAFLTFANLFCDMGAKVRVPTSLNAVSVDLANWQAQGVNPSFGRAASRLAECYVSMGAAPTFTCAPYLLDDAPKAQESIAWAESNAVVFANSVLGARSQKHPDFLDLCIAITGRAPFAGVYRDEHRVPQMVVVVSKPDLADDLFWPLLGWLVGEQAQDRVPIIRGLEHSAPSRDDLKALCAAFGTTAAAPLLHVANITPEAKATFDPAEWDFPDDEVFVHGEDFKRLWNTFNQGEARIDLVALGSPHFSLAECRDFLRLLDSRTVHPRVHVLITLGRHTNDLIGQDGTRRALEALGVQLVIDVCWCSITEPVFPPGTKVVMTNSGKYAHYGPGLSGRTVRLGSLADCAMAALTGRSPTQAPAWLRSMVS